MPRLATPTRRVALLSATAVIVLVLVLIGLQGGSIVGAGSRLRGTIPVLSDATLNGAAVAPKLDNETAKAELGQAAWKVFHTTFARFPDVPSADQSLALDTYIRLFSRLYPCGECATHFQEILQKFPPQVSSRSAAAAWGCHVHNEVNKSLQKPTFDCSKIGDFYHCGCGEDDGWAVQGKGGEDDDADDGAGDN